MKKVYVYNKAIGKMIEKHPENEIPLFSGPPHDAMSLIWENYLLKMALISRQRHSELYEKK